MGGSRWSDSTYRDRATLRAATGAPTFAYSAAVHSGAAPKAVHDSLNIHGKIRESRDSDAHPESTPIAVFFDVTGSMHTVPEVMQVKLPQLMGFLLRKGYIQDPQVLFGAIGDYFADSVPLQVGQFESGIEMEDNVTNLFLEGGGGGSYEESYQNALYVAAYRTVTDAWEKRGKKGYLFLIGDEKPYKLSKRGELQKLIDDGIETDAKLESIVEAAKEKWNVFFVIPSGTSHYHDPVLRDCWSKLLGPQNVIMLDNPETVCEAIGLAIGLCEGTTTVDGIVADLDAVGSGHLADDMTKSLGGLAAATALAKVGTGGSLPERAPTGATERL